MTETTVQIATKGHWKVAIRPTKFVEERLDDVTQLFPLVQRCSVQIRGWDFPHIDNHNAPLIGENFVSQEINWAQHKEWWRFYQSGLFQYLGGFTLDWFESWANVSPPVRPELRGKILGVGDVVARFAEFFGFASAYAAASVIEDSAVFEVACVGLAERQLWVDSSNRFPFSPNEYVCRIPEYVQSATFGRQKLIAESESLALQWARELFRRFGWNPSLDILESSRREFR